MSTDQWQHITLLDVARHAQVARTTVSGILNKRPDCRVTEQTRQRVLRAAEELGYRPSGIARALRGGASGTLGMIVSSPHVEITARKVTAFEALARERGYLTFMSITPIKADSEDDLIDAMMRQRIDGLLMTPHADSQHAALQRLAAQRFPVVTFNGNAARIPSLKQIDDVMIDHTLGGQLQAQHMADVGCRRLCIIRIATTSTSITERRVAACARLHDLGLPEPTIIDVPRGRSVFHDAEQIAQTIEGTLRKVRGKFDGLIATNDMTAQLAIRAITKLGMRVPEDMAVIGYDDDGFATTSPITLTTIRQPAQKAGETAFKLLHRRLTERGDAPGRHECIEPTLVVRESTARR